MNEQIKVEILVYRLHSNSALQPLLKVELQTAKFIIDGKGVQIPVEHNW